MTQLIFHPNSAASANQMRTDKGAQLRKLVPEKRISIVIPESPLLRCLVPIHFGDGMTKSRLCTGSITCEDCNRDIPLTFHLYVGGYDPATGEKIIVGLGTAIPKRWSEKLPTFKHPFYVWRQTERSPIMLEERTGIQVDPSGFKPWDVMPDVLRIFHGRRSADQKQVESEAEKEMRQDQEFQGGGHDDAV